MSNEVVPIKDIMAALVESQQGMIQTGVDEDTRAVAGSGGGKRISIKGGVFRKMVGGKEIAAIEERHMNIIFVKMSHTASRTYYAAAYKEGVSASPVCWSSDARTPDKDVKEPVAAKCDACPHSIKGTGQNGQGTACRISWRTAVVLPSDPSGDVMQLVIPGASAFGKEDAGRWPFRAYVQMLANHNISAGRVITKMSFDTKAQMPRILFSPVGSVAMEDLDTVLEQAKSLAAENAIKLTVFQQDESEATEVAQPEPVKAASSDEEVPEPKLRQDKSQEATPEKDVSDIVKKWSKKG